jgi:hypothetical protein
MKKILLPLLALAFCFGQLPAATINWGASQSNGFGSSNGVDLPQGDLVEIGTFLISDSQIQANISNISYLTNHFVPFASGFIGDNTGTNGILSESSTANPTNINGQNIVGFQLYYWVFNAATIAASTQQGIFYLNLSQNANWAIPVQSPVPGFATTDISDLTTNNGTNLATGATLVWGQFDTNAITPALGGPMFITQAVPEPSSWMLLGLGLAVALTLSRRKCA